MESLVIQIGDCNAPATFQSLMNYLFSAYIGVFMDVYLDDIVIYSNTLEDHIKHVKIVIDILAREKLYLSQKKLQFLCKELKLLGRIIDDAGIRMDPAKVDSVLSWKTPTNRDLLRGFLGSLGYLAEDLGMVRIPMGVLHGVTGDTVPFRWEFTHQRAFEESKEIVQAHRDHHRVPLEYGEGAPPIWMITDGCNSGIAGVVSQGEDWKTAKVAAFFSAKLNPAQQNYPVHEIEMLAGIETMLRHRDILQGARFKWLTDHKGLEYLFTQKDLSGRQARWIQKCSSFDFEIVYVKGTDNVLADALSRIYSNDSPGTVRAPSEYSLHDDSQNEKLLLVAQAISMPVSTGAEAKAITRSLRSRKIIPGAETGRPETSAEFAARVKDHFVLKGPRKPEAATEKQLEKGINGAARKVTIKIPSLQSRKDAAERAKETAMTAVKTASDLIADLSDLGETAEASMLDPLAFPPESVTAWCYTSYLWWIRRRCYYPRQILG
jgi:hypothetical protein